MIYLKLFDLQQNCYLELGKDFMYGGDYIFGTLEKSLSSQIVKLAEHSDKQLNNFLQELGGWCYGCRYLLLENGDAGKIFHYHNNAKELESINIADIEGCPLETWDGRATTETKENIFEEFAKKQLGQENKFDLYYNLCF